MKKITLEFPVTDTEATQAPYWIIIDPKQMLRLDVHKVAEMITGVFFSREEATDYLRRKQHHFSKNARVYCHSGHHSMYYLQAWLKGDK